MKRFIKSLDLYIVALFALVTLLGILIFYRLFGEGLFYISKLGDIKEQYIHFFNLFHELVRSGELPFWSWSYGPGGSFWNEFGYYMLGDVFIWPLLLLPAEWFPHTFIPISILKLFLMSLGMYLFLKEFGINRHYSFLAGIAYSFAILYFEYFYTHYFFVNSAVFFPYILLGYEKYIGKNKKAVLITFIFLASISNFYFLFMTTIGLGFYSIFRYFAYDGIVKTFKGFILFHVNLAGVYLGGVGLSMFILLPSALGLFESNFPVRPDKPFFEPFLPFAELVQKLIWDGGISFLPFVTVPLLFINGKKKLVYGIMAVSLILLIVIQNINSIIGGFSLPYEFRSFFIFNTFFILLSAIVLNDFDENKTRNIVSMIFLSVWLFFWLEDHPFTHYSNYLKFTPILFVLGLMLSTLIKGKLIRVISFSMMSISIILYSLLNPYSFVTDLIFKTNGTEANEGHKGVWGTLQLLSRDDYDKFYDNEEVKAALELLEEDRDFYRIYVNHPGITAHNSSMTYDYYSFYTYNSLVKWNLQYFEMDFLGQLGSRSLNLLRGYPNSTVINTLLNNKYWVSFTGKGTNLYGYEQIVKDDNLVIEKNKHWLPIGFMYNHAISYEELDTMDFSLHEEILLRNVSIPDDIYKKYNLTANKDFGDTQIIGSLKDASFDEKSEVSKEEEGTLVQSDVPIEIELPIEEHRLSDLKVFIDLVPYTKNDGMTINVLNDKGLGFKLEKSMRNNQYVSSQYSYKDTINKVLFRMGKDSDSKSIKIVIQPGEFLLKEVKVLSSEYTEYDQQIETHKQNSLKDITVKNNRINGRLTAEKDSVLFLSIPFSKGWEVFIDGKEAEAFPAHHAYTGVIIPEGKHEVELKYTPEGFKTGAGLSLLTAVLLVWWGRKRHSRYLKGKEDRQ
jgi:uncharacterized membrane protein YfhO